MLSGMIRMTSARGRLEIGFNRCVPSLSIAFAIGVPGQFPFLIQKLGTRQRVTWSELPLFAPPCGKVCGAALIDKIWPASVPPGPSCVGRRRREQVSRGASAFPTDAAECGTKEPRAVAACQQTGGPSLLGKNDARPTSSHK